jgi:hypothetical protein
MEQFRISMKLVAGVGQWTYHLLLSDEEDGLLHGQPIKLPVGFWHDEENNQEMYKQLGDVTSRLVTQLEYLDQLYKNDPDMRAIFWGLFSDARWMVANPVPSFLEVDTGGEQASVAVKRDLECMSAAFFRAVCLFLGAGNRYASMNARLIYLFASWQWYNLVKRLTVNQRVDGMLYLSELGEAYRLIVRLLNEPEFSQAMRWLAVWGGVWQRNTSGPLLREKMRLSLPLIWSKPASPRDNIDVTKVIAAPGFYDIEPLVWTKVKLHNVFDDRDFVSGRTDIRSLITEWLLPRYDFTSTLLMARLLRKNVSLKWKNIHWLTIFMCFVLIIAGLMVGYYGAAERIELLTAINSIKIWIFVQWIPVFLIIYLAWRSIEHGIFPYLALPRVIGGTFIGYIALVVEDYSQEIGITLWTDNIWPGILLWAIILAAGYLYLYYDVRPLVGQRIVAAGRALFTMSIALSIALVSGMATVALVTAMGDYCVSLPNASSKCFLGWFGWVDLYQFITFVPLALLTGLVTQFIFEERTVTASIWSSEQQ